MCMHPHCVNSLRFPEVSGCYKYWRSLADLSKLLFTSGFSVVCFRKDVSRRDSPPSLSQVSWVCFSFYALKLSEKILRGSKHCSDLCFSLSLNWTSLADVYLVIMLLPAHDEHAVILTLPR